MARSLVTSDNFSPLVLIITWFLCAISVLGMVARWTTKIMFRRSKSLDDYSSISALLLSIAQSVTVHVRTSNGLGKHSNTLHTSQLSDYSKASQERINGQNQSALIVVKATYAGNFLYIASLFLSELSILLLVNNITPVRRDTLMLFGVGSIMLAWAGTGVVVSAAECGSPVPWDYFHGHCISRVVWWNYFEVMNIVINITLIVLPVFIVSRVQFPLLKKVSIGFVFSLRITVCSASVVKLVYWNRSQDSADLTFVIWPTTICTQTIQCLSIVSFCSIYLKPLFETLETGFIRTDDLRRKGQKNPEGSYNLSNISSGRRYNVVKDLERLTQNANNETQLDSTAFANGSGWDGGSQSSEAQIVKATDASATEGLVGERDDQPIPRIE